MIELNHTKIGMWGFGIVGKSVVRCFQRRSISLDVFDQRPLSPEEDMLLHDAHATRAHDLVSFLEQNDYIIVSPGIDTREYAHYNHKFLAELDLFYLLFDKPIIALTGTIGKTTSVHLITHLLAKKGLRIGLGGNVGRGMCDLVDEDIDYAVLEVSSFQLEKTKMFAPDVAVWTNLYPNHLDRHGTMHEYFMAKYQIMRYQQQRDYAIVHYDLQERVYAQHPASRIIFFTDGAVASPQLRDGDKLYYIEDGFLCLYEQGDASRILSIDNFPRDNFLMNYVVAYCVATVLDQKISADDFAAPCMLPAHRMEHFLTHNNISFYNDSKATVPQATLAAIKRLEVPSIVLILGGTSKGVDRSIMFDALPQRVRLIIVFGKEREELARHAQRVGIAVVVYETHHDMIAHVWSYLAPYDTVLFSPSGASYDLFKNYEERGDWFKQSIVSFVKNC